MYSAHHTVRFNEVDGANILFFSRLFEICHVAYEELLDEAGAGLREMLEDRDWRMPVVHADGDFIAPMRLGDVITVEVSIAKTGRSSITWQFELLGSAGSPLARARHVHAAVDTASFTSRPIPEELLEALRAAGH